MRKLMLGLLVLSLTQVASAQNKVTGGRVTEFGLYRIDVVRVVVDSLAASGNRGTATNIVLIQPTAGLSGKVGTQFGYRYTVDGPVAGDTVQLKLVTRFPPTGVRNPATGTTTFMNQRMVRGVVGASSWTGYSLDDPWEVVPGVWTFEVWYNDKKLISQNFTVEK